MDTLRCWVTAHYAILGIAICGLYCFGFIIWNSSASGRLIRSKTTRFWPIIIFLCSNPLIIPVIFIMVGAMASIVFYGECARVFPDYCDGYWRSNDFCLVPGACNDVQVWEEPGNVAVIQTLFNGFGKVTVGFQLYIVIPIVILIGLGRYVVYPMMVRVTLMVIQKPPSVSKEGNG